MSESRAVARNTIIQTAGKVVSVALGWATVLMMTRSLGAVGFGAYTIMTAYLQFFGVAVDLGFVLVSSQLLAERAHDQERVFANLITFRLVTAAAVLALAPAAIWLFPYSVAVKQGVVVLTFSFFLAALMQVFTGFFQKELKMGRVLVGEIVSRVVLIGFIADAIATGGGLATMLIGVVAGAAANFALLYVSTGRIMRVRLAYDVELWRTMWHRSWPLMTTIILNLIYLKADTVILSLTRSEAEVGVYGAMYRVFEVLVTFPTMFAGLLLPILSAARARGDREAFGRTAEHGLETLIFAAVPLVIGVAFTAPAIVALFGPDFTTDGPTLLRLLVLANASVFVSTYLAHLVVAADAQRRMIVPFGITAAVGLVGYLVFIPRYGAYGAAWMTLAAELTIAVLAYLVAKRTMDARLFFRRPFMLSLAACIPMALWLWLAGTLPLAVTISVAGAIYLAVLYFLGGFSREFVVSLVRPPTS